MRVLVSDNLGQAGIDLFEAASGIDVDVNTGLDPDELKSIIGSYDALVIRSATKVTEELLAEATNLKVIGRAGIGLDNVDIPAATKARHHCHEHPHRQCHHHGRTHHRHDDGIDPQYPLGHFESERRQVGKEKAPGARSVQQGPRRYRVRQDRFDCRRPGPGPEDAGHRA